MRGSLWAAIRALQHSMVKPFALLAYRFRESRRFRQNFPTMWRTQQSLISEDLALHADVEGKDKVGEKFLDSMVTARSSLVLENLRYRNISLAISAYFVLTILSIDLPVSVAGIELKKVAGLNELLVIASALLTMFGVIRAVRLLAIDAAISASISISHDLPELYFYRAAFASNDFVTLYNPHYMPHLVWAPLKIRLMHAFGISAAIVVFSLLALLLGFRFYVAWWVLNDPSTENAILLTLVVIAPILELGSALFILLYYVPLPHRDYMRLHQIEELQKVFPESANRLRAEIYDASVEDYRQMVKKRYIKDSKHDQAE